MAMSDPFRAPPRNPIANLISTIARAVVVAIGLFLMIIAIPLALITPIIPVGLPIFIVGTIIVAAASKTAHTIITNQLKRWPWLWSRIKRAFGE